MGRSDLTAMLMGGVAVVAMVAPAQAQTATYNIPKGELRAALATYIRQSGVQLVFRTEDVRGRRTRGVRGSMSAEAALDQLLAGTGLSAVRDTNGAVVVAARQAQRAEGNGDGTESADAGATPEILVTGKRGWSLNTDIRRSRDDPQPYIVFDREQIQRSGSTNLEDFFRDYLNANAGGPLSTSSGFSSQGGGINLRGLGSDETLILVDGRRIAPINSGGTSGRIDQPNISGIPMGAIDRIEVLASSASGIYGSNATGGVINIVLKRDYQGIEASATYGGTYDGGATQKRFDISAGTNLWGGRTNVMATFSYQKNDPLYVGQREFLQGYGQRLFTNNPNYATVVPLGATPNIRSSTGVPLTLKPAYGGGSLGSNFTYVPYGYRGVALDGVAGLVANAGKYNFDLAPAAQSGSPVSGAKTALINGSEVFAGTLAVRQEVTPWLKAFVEAAGNENRGRYSSISFPTITLAATAPNNPFNQALTIAVPQIGALSDVSFKTQALRLTGGVIVTLPYGWQASADYAWNKTWFSYEQPKAVSASQLTAMRNGSLDVLRDLTINPIAYTYGDLASFSDRRPVTATTASLRLAGPLPVTLPGGKPTLTIQYQRAQTDVPGAKSYNSLQSGSSSGFFLPPSALTTDSGYFEAKLPVIGASNEIPFINALEFQVAGRYERYTVTGPLTSVQCFSFARPLTPADLELPCPPTTAIIPAGHTSKAAFNPTYSFKWQVVPDLAFRGSYATGYRPPDANRLISTNINLTTTVTDPLRGNEPIGTLLAGTFYTIPGKAGGNSDVRPEHATSYTAGAVLTPRGIPNIRLSVDWTKIIKRDNYYDAAGLLTASFTSGAAGQALFNSFLAEHPERFTRGAPSGGYSVGPITFVDASVVNLTGSKVGAIDFAADYSSKLGGGTLDFSFSATWLYQFEVQVTGSSPVTKWTGVASGPFFGATGADGGPEWKANTTLRYSTDRWSLGARAHYFSGYWLDPTHSYVATLGNSVPAQTFFDLFGSYKILRNTELSAGARNVFNRMPTYDPNALYSGFGDPRGASYYVTLSQKF